VPRHPSLLLKIEITILDNSPDKREKERERERKREKERERERKREKERERERGKEREGEREKAESASVLKAFLIQSVSQSACVIIISICFTAHSDKI
jgi:hypothetical protein